ncbi:MAG: UPF0182 family protein [candidate division WS1 bacterium]|nr:UPF0182 family protein [candidate division WS1 bacterium]
MATSNRWVLYLFAVVFGLVLIAKGLTLYTDYLWFGSFGQEAVFTTIFWNRVVLGVVVAGLFFAFFYANLRFARRPLPGDVTFIGRRLLPEEEREQIEQYADRALLLFAAVGAVMAGVVASAHWIEWLQYANWVPFNQADPVFGKDAGFYVFRLRFIEYMWQSLYYALVVTFVFSVVVHLYQEAIRLVGNTVQAIPRARAHALGLLAATLLVKIYSYRLAQYDLLFGNASGAFRGGAGWTDIHARLPVLYLLMAASLAAAIIAIVAIRTRNYKLPAGAVAALILLSLLGGTVYPLAMQKLVVVPNELEYERPYIARNIEATNFAYGTHEVEDRSIAISNDITPETIRDNWATIENIRLWDHRPLQRTYNQEQALRAYYNFPDVDVDRYMVDGRIRQVMLAPRQLNADKLPGRERWVNRNLKYTHGYGITLAPVNETNAEGRPNYWVHGIPLTVSQDIGIPSLPQQENTPNLGIYYGTATHPRMIERMRPPEQPLTTQQPQAQPGAETPEGPGTGQPATGPNQPRRGYGGTPEDITAQEFVIVNTKEQELHYSRGGEGTGEIDNAYIHYDGTGGVQLSSYFRRFAFFARFFPDVRILFTNLTTHESRIQINRTLPERMQAIAPFMMYDPDPYIVIDEDGSLKWINDAYTISGKYPYSQGLRPLGNYFRNSVKVVCDAYNGTPEYYIVDDTDPLVQCYDKIFPTLFKRGEEMSDHLRSHLRVPQLLFTLQVGVYADYHMKDPEVFYQGEDRWAMPPEIYSFGRRMVEAYYVVMRLPGEEEPEFLIMMPLVLQGQEERNMVAWMAARCDGPNYGELMVYHFPKGQLVYGPWMIESRIGQDPTISSQITLWSQAGSNVIRGNLLVIPLENSLLYVEPLYLEAEDTGLPELRKVILVYGDSIAFSDTIEGALTQIFGDLGVEVELPDDAFEPPTAATPGAESGVLETVRQTLDRILALNRDAEAARARGDVVTYFELNQQQTQLLDQLGQQIEQETGGAINGTGAPAAP